MARKKPTLAGISVSEHLEGLNALDNDNQNKLNLAGLSATESVDIDQCFEKAEPNATRWDYYIGLKKHGELYVEVHKVNEQELGKLLKKAAWLRDKIEQLNWPLTAGRPLLVAPTAGIAFGATHGNLSRQLALKKITIVMKGVRVADIVK
jgi:hypothetical protein